MSPINITNVARHYADLPHQNQALALLQGELNQRNLTAETQAWVKKFRTEPQAPVAPPGKSIAAIESIRAKYSGVIDWYHPQCHVSEFFIVQEVTQGDRRRIPINNTQVARNILNLARELDKIRKAFGPIGVSSWYRPEPINSQVGGVKDSKHTLGLAADIYPLTAPILTFQSWLDKHWGDALGYGAHKGFVHVDIRSGGGFERKSEIIRWDY